MTEVSLGLVTDTSGAAGSSFPLDRLLGMVHQPTNAAEQVPFIAEAAAWTDPD